MYPCHQGPADQYVYPSHWAALACMYFKIASIASSPAALEGTPISLRNAVLWFVFNHWVKPLSVATDALGLSTSVWLPDPS